MKRKRMQKIVVYVEAETHLSAADRLRGMLAGLSGVDVSDEWVRTKPGRPALTPSQWRDNLP
jgi:hypothetical protein